MPSAKFSERLPYRVNDMVSLVTDVERYPEFLSFVAGLRILGGRKPRDNGEAFEAEMAIRYKMIREKVRCRVDVDFASHTINVVKSGRDGALKDLVNKWTFSEQDNGHTLVELHVDVTLKATPLNYLVAQKFGVAGEKILSAFKERAAQLYEEVPELG